ncbi:MAG: H-type lectin domain-containing protein [Melioribacteraceae bacterium]|jgi:hypothetical protein|nr:H-type lectin domain-containing protein [Melioribacteraceae bacterium]RJP60753.1 MAG: hypothetical protein C4543_04490 [Ignavibacteriales bacterium]WKZ68625.1 MAG: H-type lectin domain-containing protein [Melioribacteraceae bacterium]
MKKVLFAALFLILSVGLFAQQIESGVFDVNSNTKGYSLDKNSGDRIFTLEVRFNKPFETIPDVVVGLNKMEFDKNTNARVDVQASAVSRDGFVLRIKTWGDTRVLVLGGSWVAHN